MTITQLIAELQEAYKHHGDLVVVTSNGRRDGHFLEASEIEVFDCYVNHDEEFVRLNDKICDTIKVISVWE